MFRDGETYDFERFKTVMIQGEEYGVPDFVVSSGDYRLQATSSAVDSGADVRLYFDLDGHDRWCGERIDMGAFERGGCPAPHPFMRGDANIDGGCDMSDAVFVLGFLFLGTDSPACEKAADTDDSGTLDISDAVYLLTFLYLGGASPPWPFTDCGFDRSHDALTCNHFPGCESS
jgi:hypothetical protein